MIQTEQLNRREFIAATSASLTTNSVVPGLEQTLLKEEQGDVSLFEDLCSDISDLMSERKDEETRNGCLWLVAKSKSPFEQFIFKEAFEKQLFSLDENNLFLKFSQYLMTMIPQAEKFLAKRSGIFKQFSEIPIDLPDIAQHIREYLIRERGSYVAALRNEVDFENQLSKQSDKMDAILRKLGIADMCDREDLSFLFPLEISSDAQIDEFDRYTLSDRSIREKVYDKMLGLVDHTIKEATAENLTEFIPRLTSIRDRVIKFARDLVHKSIESKCDKKKGNANKIISDQEISVDQWIEWVHGGVSPFEQRLTCEWEGEGSI